MAVIWNCGVRCVSAEDEAGVGRVERERGAEANLDDEVGWGVLVEKVLQGVIFVSTGLLALGDDRVEGGEEDDPKVETLEVGGGEYTNPGKDHAECAVAALEFFEDRD